MREAECDAALRRFEVLRPHTRRHGFPPSRKELANNLGLSHPSSADGRLSALQVKGWIEIRPDTKRGIRPIGDEVTLKRFVRLDERHVELRPDSHNAEHQPIKIDLAKRILHIDGVAGAHRTLGQRRRLNGLRIPRWSAPKRASADAYDAPPGTW